MGKVWRFGLWLKGAGLIAQGDFHSIPGGILRSVEGRTDSLNGFTVWEGDGANVDVWLALCPGFCPGEIALDL